MRVSSVLSAGLLIGTSFAQQTAQDSNVVIKSSAQEVLLEVVVRDAHGKLVTKVDPAQVEIFENGVRQDIRSFRLVQGSEVRAQDEKQIAEAAAAQTEPGSTPAAPALNPLRTINIVCLVMNDLNPETRAFAFDAARKFVNKELRPDTFIGVFSLDASGLRPVFPFSNNREHLLKAVEMAAMNQLPTLRQTTAAMLNGLSLTAGNILALNSFAPSNNAPPLSTGLSATGVGAVNGGSDPGAQAAAMLQTFGNSDGSGPQDPLGIRGDMGVATIAGLREIDALTKLVRQLSAVPFQKTVLLMGTGLTRPPDQMEYWRSLISSANKGGVTFYGLDVYGLGVCQDSSTTDCANATTATAASVSLLQQSAGLSQGQSTVGAGAGQLTPRPGGGVNIGPSQAPQVMESMHQSDYVQFAVSSANAQEALRELAESTGGFSIANTNNSEKLLARVMEEVDTHYEISYRPASVIEDGRFRKIEVKLTPAGLRVETRSGYFAVPDTSENPLTPADMAGLRALDSNPQPHSFDFQTKAFRFRSEDGVSQYAIAFEVPISNLTGTAEAAEKKHRYHASLLALVKNPQGQIVERVSRDVPSDVPDKEMQALLADSMTYEHAVILPHGRYTIETAVVDQEGNRASTKILEIDDREQSGVGLSDIALMHVVKDLKRAPDETDPFEIPGKRASPFVSNILPAGADPFIYFVVYPEKNSPGVPGIEAQFVKDDHVLATQKSALPAPDESGAIPITIRAIHEPGQYEVRIKVDQGRATVERSLKYSIAAK